MKKEKNIVIEVITSKSFIGSFIFAIALWVYTSLNAEYTIFQKIPLSVVLPSNRAIASEIPSHIQVELKGTGWHLLNLYYINSNIGCKINLSAEKDFDSIKITRKEFSKGLYNSQNLATVDFAPESFVLQTGKVDEVDVPIRSNIQVTPYEGYMVVGDILLHPNMVVLKGNHNKISGFTYWQTKYMKIDGLSDNYETTVYLSDSLSNIIQLSENPVNAQINIQQIAEQIIYDVPIKINGGNLNGKHKLMPEFITVIVRGGINQLYDFNPELISASVNIDEILKDSTGRIIPEINVPRNIKTVSIYPKFLTHKIIENISKK